MPDMQPIAVMMLNLGGPSGPDDVRPFLFNLFSDRLIIKLGPAFMQKPIAWMIARKRAPKSRAYYEKIGGGSPLVRITREQASALQTRLREHGDFTCHIGMRYWEPYTREAVAEIARKGVHRMIGLSLYPQYSIATTGSSEADLAKTLKGTGMEVAHVEPWYAHPQYLDALAGLVRQDLRPETLVIFSAHSLPESFVTKDGDPYVEHIMATIRGVEERVPGMRWKLGYQSRSGPVKWLSPPTEQVIAEAAASGETDALVVPVSFVSDHIETLYEIDIQYREYATGLGLPLRRIAALNTTPGFIAALENLVLTKAREMGWA
jgi:ferrochelatase